MKRSVRRWTVSGSLCGLAMSVCPATFAQPPVDNLSQPIYKVAKNDSIKNDSISPATNHSLDPALKIARDSLARIREGVNDYTAVLVKRERVNNQLGDHEFIYTKVRNRKFQNGQIVTPFSVYLGFAKPDEVKGREVLYVEGKHNDKLLAHEGGMKRMLGTLTLDPTGSIAMMGQRYPVTDIGLENLTTKLIERGERDKAHGECQVQFLHDANIKVGGRPCTVLRVVHPDNVRPYDFHIAEVFIDDQMQIPVRYAAYSWPTPANPEPEVIEEYTYQNIKINPGLTDADFDQNNPNYNFGKRQGPLKK